jgi:hypothetical protein
VFIKCELYFCLARKTILEGKNLQFLKLAVSPHFEMNTALSTIWSPSVKIMRAQDTKSDARSKCNN